MPNLSRDYTVNSVWREAVRDFPADQQIPHYMALDIVNRAQSAVAGQFYDLMSQFYMTDATFSVSAAGSYSTASGTYTLATATLSIAMSTNFSASDVGKMIVFRMSSDVYIATVKTYLTASSVIVDGASLPSSGGAVSYAILCPTSVTADYISIAAYRIMMTGQQVRMSIESSATSYVSSVSMDELRVWRSSAVQNKDRIVFSLSGEKIFLKKGTSLSSFGTLTIHYPRVPALMTAMTDYVDIPDGAATGLLISTVRSMVAPRIGIQLQDQTNDIAQKVQAMYSTFAQEASAEEIIKKVQSLK